MNDKGYPDPTAEQAIGNVCREQKLKKKKQDIAKDKADKKKKPLSP